MKELYLLDIWKTKYSRILLLNTHTPKDYLLVTKIVSTAVWSCPIMQLYPWLIKMNNFLEIPQSSIFNQGGLWTHISNGPMVSLSASSFISTCSTSVQYLQLPGLRFFRLLPSVHLLLPQRCSYPIHRVISTAHQPSYETDGLSTVPLTVLHIAEVCCTRYFPSLS